MVKLQGIDVSVHQGDIDWKKVRAAGKQFVFVRLGWAGYDGKIVANGGLDKKFHDNVKGALEAGLQVGVYVYSYVKTASAAKIAAEETLELVRNYDLTYPVAFDIEDQLYRKTGRALNNLIVAAYLSEIEAGGYYGLLYTYKNFAESCLDMAQLSAYDVWIAQYAAKCTYEGPYGIWQYAGPEGRCPGIETACDLDEAYKDYAEIIRAAGLNRPERHTLDEVEQCMADLEGAVERLKPLIEYLVEAAGLK